MSLIENFIRETRNIESGNRLCEEIWNDKNKLVLKNERLIKEGGYVNWNYVKHYKIGYLLDAPPIKNKESIKRLRDFTDACLSENASLSQGYYFDNDGIMSQFMKGVLYQYYMWHFKRYYETWKKMDSVELTDLYMTKKIRSSSFNEHELFFVVNSYNRYCNSKKHKMLYYLVNAVKEEREKNRKRTFILSLTKDVGPDKDIEHGFSIPMFPIKERICEVLETKANGKNPW